MQCIERQTLWDPLHLLETSARVIGLLTGLYSKTVSAVKYGGSVSSFFPVNKKSEAEMNG